MTSFAKKILSKFVFGPNILRKMANMQKSIALKKLCLAFFSKVKQNLQVLKNPKTSRLIAFKKKREAWFFLTH